MNLAAFFNSVHENWWWFSGSLASRVTLTLAHFAWQGCLIAGLFILANAALRRNSANARYVLGVVALALLAVCPLLTFGVLTAPSERGGAGDDSAARIATDLNSSPIPLMPAPSELNQTLQRNQKLSLEAMISFCHRAMTRVEFVSPYVATAYAAGVVALLLRLMIGLWTGHRLCRAAVVVVDDAVQQLVYVIANKWAMPVVPVVAYCQQVSVPVVVGVLRPLILLPPALMTGLSPYQLEAVLLHELAHLRRWDLTVNLFQRVVEACLFIHPAVWYVSHRISIEREHACDDLVLLSGWKASDYVGVLLGLADFCAASPNSTRDTAVLLAASGTRPSQLKQRVLRLLGESAGVPPRLSRSGFGGLMVTLCMMMAAWSVLAGRPQVDAQPSNGSSIDLVTEEPRGLLESSTLLAGDQCLGSFGDRDEDATNSPTEKLLADDKKVAESTPPSPKSDEEIRASTQPTLNLEEPFRLDQPLVDVVIEGNSTILKSEISKQIKTRPGLHVTQQQIKDDVDALVRTRWFVSVEPAVRRGDDGVVLVFRVLERSLVRRVEYRGLKKMKQKTFDALTQLKPGSPFDIGSNRECARRIEEYYHEKGFAFATVELEKGNDRDDREVVFLINEGPKVHVTSVKFEGNEERTEEILKTKTRDETRTLWLFGGKYDPSSIKDDVEGLKRYYHGLGYLDVEIKDHLKFSDDKADVEFHYEVCEGVRYRIGNIEIVGNSVLTDEDLRSLMKVQADTFYSAREIGKDIEAIKTKYREQGRPFCQITAELVWQREQKTVDVRLNIAEGEILKIPPVEIMMGPVPINIDFAVGLSPGVGRLFPVVSPRNAQPG